jgi:hypothetical protein
VLYLLNATRGADPAFFCMALLAGFMSNMNGPNVRVVLQVSLIYHCLPCTSA